MLRSILFMLPVLIMGIWTVAAVQDAVGFGNFTRDVLLAALLIATFAADDRFGPRAARREREGRR
jgi:hypothetical protein